MSSREAAIFVTMDQHGFVTGLRTMQEEVKRVGKAAGPAISSPLNKGFANVRKNASADLAAIGGHLKTLATLGGAVSAGALVMEAQQLQGLYAQVAFEMQRVTGEAFSIAQAQAVVVRASAATKRTHEEMATAMRTMLDRGADPRFAVESMKTVGDVMNATGMDAERIGRLLAGLSNKYGVNGQEAASAISSVLESASAGRIQMEEFMEDFNEFGSIAQLAGLKGSDGLNVMMNMVREMGPQLNGTTSEINSGMDILFERMRDAGKIEGILRAVYGTQKTAKLFDRNEFAGLKDARAQMDYLMRQGPQVMKLFSEEFTGREEKAAFNSFVGPYFDLLNEGIAAGKTEAQAHLAAVERIKARQTDLGAPIKAASDVAAQSATMQATSAAKMRDAMNKLAEAMTSEEALKALDSLADTLPQVASMFAKALEFATKHPYLTGTMVVGARVGMSFAGGALGNAGADIAKSFGGALQTSLAGPAAGAGTAMALAANAAMVVGAGVIGYQIGKAIADAYLDEQIARTKAAQSANIASINAQNNGDEKEKQTALDDLRRKRSALIEERDSFGTSMAQGMTWFFQGAPVSDMTKRNNFDIPIAQMDENIATLEAQIAKQKAVTTSAENLGRALDEAGRSARFTFGQSVTAPPAPLPTSPGWYGISR